MDGEYESKYNIGDVVKVVDVPYMDCPFSWADEMTEYCGQELTIVEVRWISHRKTYGYTLDGVFDFVWCEGCFESCSTEIEESDADLSILFQ